MKRFENGIIANGVQALRIWKRWAKDETLYIAFKGTPTINPKATYYIFVDEFEGLFYRGELVFTNLINFI